MSPGQRIAVLTRRLSLEAQSRAILATCSAGTMWSADGPVFTDIAGTTIAPIGTAAARMNDLGPFVNPVTQATSGNRPLFSRRVNLLTYSEDFTNAVWPKTTSSILANTTVSPIGTVGASSLVGNGTNGIHSITQTIILNTAFSWSIYLKQNTERYAYLLFLGRSGTQVPPDLAYVDLQTGTLLTNTIGNVAISAAGNGWYRVTMGFSSNWTSSSQTEVRIGVANAASNQLTTASGSIYIWGAQVTAGSVAQPYQRITTPTDYDTAGFPAYLDFDGVNDTLATASAIGVSSPNVFVGAAVKPTRATGTGEGLLSNARYSLERSTTGKLRFTTSAQNYDSAATAFVQNTPVVVSAVFDSSYGVTHYINGVAGSVITGSADSATAEAPTYLMSVSGANFAQGPGFAWIEASRAAPFTAAELLIFNRWLASKNGVTI